MDADDASANDITNVEEQNRIVFQDCLSNILIERVTAPSSSKENDEQKPRSARSVKSRKSNGTSRRSSLNSGGNSENDAEDLAEFISYLSEEMWPSFPSQIRHLNHGLLQRYSEASDSKAHTFFEDAEAYELPLSEEFLDKISATFPPDVLDTLSTYILESESTNSEQEQLFKTFLGPLFTTYLKSTTMPPPVVPLNESNAAPAKKDCELCGRDWIPLTQHHLIPRQIHAKALKRNWHAAEELNSCAWICRACHNAVHKCASNEELAREYYTIDALLERDDIRAFAEWVGRIRWKSK